MALSYVDAFQMGIHTKLVMNPPKTHEDNRGRCYPADLENHVGLMLRTIQNEAPEKYDDFVEQLKKDVPTIVIPKPEEVKEEAKAILEKRFKTKLK